MSQKIKQHFHISEETKGSHVRTNIPSWYNKRLHELKCIWFKARYETVAICKRLTHIYITIYYIYDIYEGIYL